MKHVIIFTIQRKSLHIAFITTPRAILIRSSVDGAGKGPPTSNNWAFLDTPLTRAMPTFNQKIHPRFGTI